MRDFAIIFVVLGSIPFTLAKPFLGVLVWTWLGLMNPHMLAFSFARGQPLAQIVGASILAGLILSTRESKIPPVTSITVSLGIFWLWMATTLPFSLNMVYSQERFIMITKILLLTYITMMLLTSRERITALVWVMALSIGFYGIKGGLFTMLGGGTERVWGPVGTFISGNNEIGLALNMTLPLWRYLQLQARNKFLRLALFAALGLTAIASLGTQSRGALVGLLITVLWLTLKSERKAAMLALVVVAGLSATAFMPETWHARMDTIQSYETDASAMGRINAWWAAWYLASDRIAGGGVGALTTSWIMRAYAPNPEDYHDAHSIYFQILANHGFIGLALYLGFAVTAMRELGWIQREARRDKRLDWAGHLAAMLNVSLVAFGVSGAFLGLAYFDYMFTEVAVIVGLKQILLRYRREGIPAPSALPSDVLPGVRADGPPIIGQRGLWHQIARWYRLL